MMTHIVLVVGSKGQVKGQSLMACRAYLCTLLHSLDSSSKCCWTHAL